MHSTPPTLSPHPVPPGRFTARVVPRRSRHLPDTAPAARRAIPTSPGHSPPLGRAARHRSGPVPDICPTRSPHHLARSRHPPGASGVRPATARTRPSTRRVPNDARYGSRPARPVARCPAQSLTWYRPVPRCNHDTVAG
jgi:hypothetical protein